MFGKGKKEKRQDFFLGDLMAPAEVKPNTEPKQNPAPQANKAAPLSPSVPSVKKPMRARRTLDKAPSEAPKPTAPKSSSPVEMPSAPAPKRTEAPHTEPKEEEKKKMTPPAPEKERDEITPPEEAAVKTEISSLYAEEGEGQKKKTLTATDWVRYGVLFVCIFGFFTAGYFVFTKLFDYYKAHLIYSGLQEIVTEKDRFSEEYLKKSTVSGHILTPAEILAGKTDDGNGENTVFSEEQETLVGKIGQLKKINPDTVGWITIEGTVVNYPIVWSSTEDYYLRRDFYGKKLTSGTIFLDERNSPDITQNRNTVIYGHNMSDGSMFASVHDFASSTVFYGTKIEIATEKGIFIYTPFSVHESNAFDNYFETDFVSDEDFLNFCEQIAFISIYETDTKFTKESQLITLSTCMKDPTSKEQRFAVHAVLTQVIR
jgi:sortase B